MQPSPFSPRSLQKHPHSLLFTLWRHSFADPVCCTIRSPALTHNVPLLGIQWISGQFVFFGVVIVSLHIDFVLDGESANLFIASLHTVVARLLNGSVDLQSEDRWTAREPFKLPCLINLPTQNYSRKEYPEGKTMNSGVCHARCALKSDKWTCKVCCMGGFDCCHEWHCQVLMSCITFMQVMEPKPISSSRFLWKEGGPGASAFITEASQHLLTWSGTCLRNWRHCHCKAYFEFTRKLSC